MDPLPEFTASIFIRNNRQRWCARLKGSHLTKQDAIAAGKRYRDFVRAEAIEWVLVRLLTATEENKKEIEEELKKLKETR